MPTHGSKGRRALCRFLGASEMRDALPMGAAISALEAIMRDAAADAALAPERAVLDVPREGEAPACTFLVMPATWATRGAAGAKVITYIPDNPKAGRPTVQGLAILIDTATGKPRLLTDASALTTIRTGAVVGLASRYLAREDSEVVGIVGTGGLAFDLVAGIAAVREVRRVVAHDVDMAAARRFVENLPWRGEILAGAAQVAAEADVLITATTSLEPLISDADVHPGVHINAVGNFSAQGRELDGAAVAACERYVDDVAAAFAEAGELLLAAEEGLIPAGAAGIAGDLRSLVTGLAEGRRTDQQRTLFKTVGTALADVACLVAAAETAEKRALGIEIEA